MEKRLMMFLAALFLMVGTALAQTKVNGTVTSQEDGQPVIGASVLVVGTQVGTVTDVNGRFSLTVPAGKSTLRITYVGMEPIEITARPNMRIMLTSDQKALDEVIVVAFGQQKKSSFTGSAKAIGSAELEKSQVTSVTDALAGAVAGVQLTQDNGSPSSSAKIRIRGFSSLNAGNDPLIIVDGAPYSGDMTNLNPKDIESMTVLKDAASNALYGARGANGVIMITTKRAKGQGAQITLDAKFGWNTRALRQYDVVKDPGQYYEMQYDAMKNYYMDRGMSANDAWINANANIFKDSGDMGVGYNIYTIPNGQMLIGQDGKLNPNATLGRIVNYKGVDYLLTSDDWLEEGTRTGARQEYNVSVSGNSDRGNYYASMGYLNNEGITANSDMKRFTARLKADYQAKEWLKVGMNINYTRFNHNSLGNNGSSNSTGNVWAAATQIAPIYPAYIRNADGTVMIDANGIGMMDYGDGKNAGYQRAFLGKANPLLDNKLNTRNFEGNAFGAHGFADFKIIDGLTLTVNGTYNLDETRGNYVYNPYYGQFDSTGGTVEMYHQRTSDYNLQQLLNYSFTLAEKHNFQLMVGHEYYDRQVRYLSASKSQMFSQTNKELGGAVVDGQSANSYKTRYNNEGYFGRVMYDYDQRYFLQASLRRDASSRFDPDYRWGTFWSTGVAWLINKESFMNDVKWVDELKFKTSIGSQGNDNIGSYRYTDVFNILNSSGKVGTSFSTKGTRDITWETNTNFNIGFEFQLFKKLTGSMEYYYRKTTDMLYSFSVAPSLGYSSYYANVGNMSNKGFELELAYNAIHTKDIDWNIHLNLTTQKNLITKLDDDKKTTSKYTPDGKKVDGYNNGNFYIAEDRSMYSWYMKDYAGVDPETGQSLWWKNKFEKDTEGNEVWVGRETTSDYSKADYYVIEETTIPKVFGGFGTSLRAYGFDFSINFTYSLGGKQYDSTYANFMAPPTSQGSGQNFHLDALNSWSSTNKGSDIPRWQWGETNSSSMSTRFLTDASYLNLQNINVGYTFPSKLTRKAFIESLRIYCSAENVVYWSKRKGFDPRQTYSDVTNATNYSPMRTISGGITVTF